MAKNSIKYKKRYIFRVNARQAVFFIYPQSMKIVVPGYDKLMTVNNKLCTLELSADGNVTIKYCMK